ncbi:MAG: hypothetical protein LBG28_02695 [Tannerella sp.]|jgi:hypothetical protein|nr:hypothetical protein [Tannerella sp.]
MNFIVTPLVVGLVFYFTYMLFELFVRKRERLFLLEKMGQNLIPPDPSILKNQFSSLLPTFPKKSFTGLRLGCLLLGLGLGLFVGLFICIDLSNSELSENHREREMFFSVAYGSSVLFFGGLGLIISYLIESKSTKKDEK